MRCENCVTKMSLAKTQKYKYIESGLENVFLDNLQIYTCPECAVQVPIIPKILKLHNAIGFAIVRKESRLTGAEVQFLRKNLRIKSQDWAAFLRSKKETVSRWENDSQTIGAQTDLLIRLLYLRLLEEKKDIRLDQKIVEGLSVITGEQSAIVINVEEIESYSYMPLNEAEQLAETQTAKITFDFELDGSNIYLSEIEKPLSLRAVKRSPIRYSAANQAYLLAA